MAAIVLKGNTELKIAEDELSRYLAMGFSQIDEKGRIIKETTLKDKHQLEVENAELKKEIISLKEQLAAAVKQTDGIEPGEENGKDDSAPEKPNGSKGKKTA